MLGPSGNRQRKIVLAPSQLLVLLAVAFCLGVYGGRGAALFGAAVTAGMRDAAGSDDGEQRFTRYAPRLRDAGSSPRTRELKPFRYKVKALVESRKQEGDATFVSVYFRDLRNGHRFGIKEQEKFSTDALLKLPLMIAYLKWAEATPLLLNRKLVYSRDSAADREEGAGRQGTLEDGRSYKVGALIDRMISYNDDDAAAVLAANIPPEYWQKVFKDVYVNYDPLRRVDMLPFNAYASFYRVLFNASYLSRPMSERALYYLSRTAYRDGLVSGVPPEVDVTAKYGERRIDGPGGPGLKQVHEFGIVYHPVHPYMLGVMVRGGDGRKLLKVIRDISALVYQEVDRQAG